MLWLNYGTGVVMHIAFRQDWHIVPYAILHLTTVILNVHSSIVLDGMGKGARLHFLALGGNFDLVRRKNIIIFSML